MKALTTCTSNVPAKTVPAKQARLSVSEPFLRWANAAGILSPKIAQSQFGNLRGYKATDDIAPEETIVTLSRHAALTLWPLQPSPTGSLVGAKFWNDAPWFIQMSLLLLWERRKGAASPLWSYIQQLPDSVDLPLRWTDQELRDLQYPPIVQEVEVQREQWRELYEELATAQRSSSSGGGGSSGGESALSWEDFLWAMENVCSRAFAEGYAGPPLGQRLTLLAALMVGAGALASWQHLPVEGALAGGALVAPVLNRVFDAGVRRMGLRMHMMCPVIDGANHRSDIQSEVQYDYLSDSIMLRARCGFRQGEQVFISYGPHCSDSLLLYYGFLEEGGNPRDTYQLEIPLEPLGPQTVQVFLDAEGRPSQGSLSRLREAVQARGGGARGSEGTMDLHWGMEGQLLVPEGLKALEEGQRRESGSVRAKDGMEALVWKLLATGCRQELQGKPTSLQDDEATLRGKSFHALPPRTRLAVQYRVLKKRLLLRCISHSQQMLEGKDAEGRAVVSPQEAHPAH